MYLAVCASVFIVALIINTTTITVGYHRALAHRALTLKPWLERFVVRYGNWLTGLDPKGWVCMHRLHHRHSDGKEDPHSPANDGLFRILYTQLKAYKRILVGLHRRDEKYTSIVADLDFGISWLNRRRVWWLPYAIHGGIALGVGLVFGYWLLGACYYFGIMSHPFEGWLVNSFGHAYGGRNFETDDNSRNNLVVGYIVMGEGYQNNHHRYPSSAKFSYRWYEFDLGFVVCRALEAVGLATVHRQKLIPSPEAVRAVASESRV